MGPYSKCSWVSWRFTHVVTCAVGSFSLWCHASWCDYTAVLFIHSALDGHALVHKLAPYTEGEDLPKKEAEHSWRVGGRLSKQGNLLRRLVLGRQNQIELRTHYQNRKTLHTGLNWGQPCVQSTCINPLLSQGCMLGWNGSHCGSWEQNVHSQDGGEGEEPPIHWAPLAGQPVAMLSQGPPPATCELFRVLCYSFCRRHS